MARSSHAKNGRENFCSFRVARNDCSPSPVIALSECERANCVKEFNETVKPSNDPFDPSNCAPIIAKFSAYNDAIIARSLFICKNTLYLKCYKSAECAAHHSTQRNCQRLPVFLSLISIDKYNKEHTQTHTHILYIHTHTYKQRTLCVL